MCGISDGRSSRECSTGALSLIRQTLAEQLHDGPLQELVALQLKVVILTRLGQLSSDDRRGRLLELRDLAQAAIDQLQLIIRDLSDGGPPPIELFGRLAQLCDQFRAETGLDCQFELDAGHVRFGTEFSDVIYRAVRELLTNVRKHARATRVRISSHCRRDGAVVISVEDNGVGLAPRSRRGAPFEGGGFGLWSIDHRLRTFDASLEFESKAGLCATIVVPQQPAAE